VFRSGRLAILLLASCAALAGCGGSSEEIEPPEGSRAAELRAAAGPLSGLVAHLEAEDDQAELAQREQEAPESAEEREEGMEELRAEEGQRLEAEEQALAEEAHVGANAEASS
jgi:hypothetical protein